MYAFDMEADENILKKSLGTYTCESEVFSGALYLTNQRLVFVGYVLNLDNKYMDAIPLSHIKELSPAKTFFVIPNVIKVVTMQDKVIKLVIQGRNSWLEAINKQMASVN